MTTLSWLLSDVELGVQKVNDPVEIAGIRETQKLLLQA